MRFSITQINLRDALAIWRRDVIVHLRVWKLNLVAPIIEPVISVLGFGLGIGALVAAKVSGVSYLSFVGAGLARYARHKARGAAAVEGTHGHGHSNT